MTQKIRRAALFLFGAIHCAATAFAAGPGGLLDHHFYVGSHGWHTSIVLERRLIQRGFWPRGVADQTFSRYRYLEIGWGDRKFYTAPNPGFAMAIDAALSPGPSAFHIVGLQPPVENALPWSALVRVPCTRAEFDNLCRAIGDNFDADGRGNVHAISSGLYGVTSRFYPARGKYYLFNTCDTWTARMLQAGGLAAHTDPISTRSAGAVIAQAGRLSAQKARTVSRPQ